MKTRTALPRLALGIGVVAAALGAPRTVVLASPVAFLRSDDPKPDDPKPGDDKNPPKPDALPAPRQSAMEIIQEIEAKMVEAEKALATATSASEGGASMQEVVKKLDELLSDANSKQQQILDALKKLEDQAVPMPSGGGGGSQDQEQKKPPKPQNRKPDQEDKSLQGLDPGNSKDGAKKEPEGKEPKNGRQKPPDSKTDKANLPKAYEVWGNLPSTIKDQINQGNFEMFPPQYRALLERFFKRLADSETSTKK